MAAAEATMLEVPTLNLPEVQAVAAMVNSKAQAIQMEQATKAEAAVVRSRQTTIAAQAEVAAQVL